MVKEEKSKSIQINFDGIKNQESNNELSHLATLFLSFDIVNSTKYKSQDPDYCLNVIKGILKQIRDLVEANITEAKFWTTRGDEIIYFLEIYSKDEIFDAVDTSFSIMNQVRQNILDGEYPLTESDEASEVTNSSEKMKIYQQTLSLKCASWITVVSSDIYDKDKPNKKYFNGLIGNTPGIIDFQGPDIDAGFRVVDGTTNRRMVISFELATLFMDKPNFARNLHLITFEKKKGVWNERKYPVIWYHSEEIKKLKSLEKKETTLKPFEKSFFYDEEDDCKLTMEYKKERKRWGNLKDVLKGIKEDLAYLGIEKKVNELKEIISKMETTERPQEKPKLASKEIHCVAVCQNDKGILILKKRDEDFYDFGCITMDYTNDERWEDVLERQYLDNLGFEIKVGSPFKTYYFPKNGRNVTGFRFLADIIREPESYELTSKEYESFKYVNKDNYKSETYRVQSEFLKILTELFERN